MARILYLMPGIEAGAEEKQRRQGIANSFLADGRNRVIVDDCDEGPISIESAVEADTCVAGMLKKALALKGTYDALIVGCAGDPGLRSMREVLDVPVVGPFESSIALARTLGDKFSVLTILQSGIPDTWDTLRKYGQDGRCASVRAIEAHVNDMVSGAVSRERVLETVRSGAESARRDGASSVVLGCMTMAFLLVDEGVQSEVVIVNPAKVAVKMAEMLVGLGIRQSRVSYPRPDMEKLGRTVLQ